MKKTNYEINNEFDEILKSYDYESGCSRNKRETLSLYEISSDIYESAKESFQNDRYCDDYGSYEFRANLYE